MLGKRLTCVIHTCDAYSDLWDLHLHFLNQNWADRGLETVLLSDRPTDYKQKGVSVFSAGEGLEMPQRTAQLLPHIQTDYVLITLDDYFPIYPIENEKIANLLNIMDTEQLDYIRLFPDPNSHRKFPGYSKLYTISLNRDYDVNLYQGIWRKSFLEKTISEELNAWQYEVTLTRIAKESKAKCVLSKGKEFEILDVIRKGKLLHKAKRYLEKVKLPLPKREVISYWEELRIWLFNHAKRMMPNRMTKPVKSVMRKFGFHFYSDSI